jgi:hypothetical protein
MGYFYIEKVLVRYHPSFCCHPGFIPGSAYTVLIADTKQAPARGPG